MKRFTCTVLFTDDEGGSFKHIIESENKLKVRQDIEKVVRENFPGRDNFSVFKVEELD